MATLFKLPISTRRTSRPAKALAKALAAIRLGRPWGTLANLSCPALAPALLKFLPILALSRPMPTPLTLSDSEMAAIFRLAQPVASHERDAYLIAVGAALAHHQAIGIGLVSRVAAELQARFPVEARVKASDSTQARHFSQKRRAAEAEA